MADDYKEVFSGQGREVAYVNPLQLWQYTQYLHKNEETRNSRMDGGMGA